MPINLFDAFVAEENTAFTTNGQAAFATTNSSLLDFFSIGGAMRQRSEADIIGTFAKAYAENEDNALRLLFYFRDVRGGQGERRTFRVLYKWLATHDTAAAINVLPFVAHLGRYDDLLALIDTPAQHAMFELVKKQLAVDLNSEMPSLLGKWLPSTNTSSPVTRALGAKMRRGLGFKQNSDYIKTLSRLRASINILERKLSTSKWDEVEYDKLPSKAGLKYRNAFFRHDEERYKAFLDDVTAGKKKVNASTLYPYDISAKVRDLRYGGDEVKAEVDLYNALWSELPNYIPEGVNTLVMADISSSMTWSGGNVMPIDVALSLAVYTAERNTGMFHNAFMTYSTNPSFVQLEGDTFTERMKTVYSQTVHYGSTNVYKAFMRVLEVAKQYNIAKEEMPRSIMVVSDMQFDEATNGTKKLITELKEQFLAAGYELPVLVFWQVNAAVTNFPSVKEEHNTLMISGASPSILKSVLSGKFTTPIDLMNDVLNNPRYAEIRRA